MKKLVFCLCSLFMTLAFLSAAVAEDSCPESKPEFRDSLKWKLEAQYADTTGKGAKKTAFDVDPFKIDNNNSSWNASFGLDEHPLFIEDGVCFKLTATIGYGRSLEIDEENKIKNSKNHVKRTIGIHLSMPLYKSVPLFKRMFRGHH